MNWIKNKWKKICSWFFVGSIIAVGVGGGIGFLTSGDDVVCVPGGITTIRFHRVIAPLNISYDDAFAFTEAGCQAYNDLSIEEKQQLQIDRAEKWLADLSSHANIGEDVVAEVGDPQPL